MLQVVILFEILLRCMKSDCHLAPTALVRERFTSVTVTCFVLRVSGWRSTFPACEEQPDQQPDKPEEHPFAEQVTD